MISERRCRGSREGAAPHSREGAATRGLVRAGTRVRWCSVDVAIGRMRYTAAPGAPAPGGPATVRPAVLVRTEAPVRATAPCRAVPTGTTVSIRTALLIGNPPCRCAWSPDPVRSLDHVFERKSVRMFYHESHPDDTSSEGESRTSV
ncbi:hypothetical protein C6Y44_10660 [Rhodococcus rhodochrous]|nr:hypothetical protein C6Y44_10660 [Rhodococcus rhodochrous]